MKKVRNKVKDIFSGARSKSPQSRLIQQSPALTASTRSSSSLPVPSTSSSLQTTVATIPLVGIGPHGVSSSSHSTLQHLGPNNTISQTPNAASLVTSNAATGSWSNMVVQPMTSLHVSAGDEIFQEQLSQCQNTLTEVQKKAFLGASATSILDMIAELNNQHSQNSTTRKYVTKLKSFLQVTDSYMNTLKIAIQHSPNVSSLIVGGLQFFIDIGKRYIDFFDKLEGTMEKWMYYLGYLSKYAEMYSHYEEVKQALCVAYGDLIEFFKCVCGIFMGETGALNSKISRTLIAQQLMQPLETSIAAIMANLNEHIAFVEKITGILEKKRQWLKEKQEAEKKTSCERREILAWLSKLKPEEDLERIYAKRHDGTGLWFLNSSKVTDWFQADKKSLLWCYGTAGVGKSVLASALLKDIISKHQDNSTTGICFFFFSFQASNTQTPINIFSVLLKQLCRCQKAIPPGLQALYTLCHSNDRSPTLLELQNQFEAVSSFFKEVFLVIDAFDECNQDDRIEILKGITRLFQTCSANLKLCVMSRPEKDIERAFISSGFSTMKIDSMMVDQDISSFVRHGLRARPHEHCTLNDEICNEIEHALLSRANGMFLWAKCQLDELFEQPSIADIRVALQSLPSDIDATYRCSLDRILKQTPAMRTLAAWALTWVIAARRPLSLAEFAQAVATNPNEFVSLVEVKAKYLPQTVVDSCCGLVTVEQDIVRPIHYTVQEFLVREWPWDNGWNSINAHSQIAQSCLRYLISLSNGNCVFEGNATNYQSFLARLGELFDYIATSWPYHVKFCSAEIPSSLKGLLQNIFSNKPAESNLRRLLHAWYLDKDNLYPMVAVSAARYSAVVDIVPVYKQLLSNDLN
ncbi:hypothetical protein BDZ91DRAFT_844127 [Kalaharituber pfeilii]|nr:hypothetical protein BDZ91DRAFT_844127 [Kalaharituber pfeilii]